MSRCDTHEFYEHTLNLYHENAKRLRWNSRQTQEIRFQMIRNYLPEDLSPFTLVDAGCGFGDFNSYILKHNDMLKHYRGLDLLPQIITEAQSKNNYDFEVCNILCDPLPLSDFYICSGAMNTLTPFETHLFIRRCFEHSRKGFIFNLLEGEDSSLIYNYVDFKTIQNLAKELHADFHYQRGYLDNDITVAFYKTECC